MNEIKIRCECGGRRGLKCKKCYGSGWRYPYDRAPYLVFAVAIAAMAALFLAQMFLR